MKRLFIAFLCIVMVMVFLPTVAFAQTNYFAVTIDGVRTEYPSAGDAVAAVGEGQTAVIELLADYNGGGVKIEAADLEQLSITVNKAPANFKLEVPVGVTVANATENPITVNDESVAADGEITVKEPETTNPDEGKDDPAVGGDDKPATEPEEKPETDKDMPKTGDSSNLVLWLTLLALTGSALAGTVVYSRKK